MAQPGGMTVVIVSYRMQRELPRTLLSLSPRHQRLRAPLPLEVIVVDNGTEPPPEARDFADLGLDLTVLRSPSGSASPVFALNQGLDEALARARSGLIGAWIDGARLASPGLLQACLDAARLHPLPVVAPLNWQIGPQRHYMASASGYDQAAEDRLLARTGWPATPYRLFAASTCETAGPAAPLLESNALFLPPALWRRLGGFDPAFDEPGGGAANPDMLIRACAEPDTRLVRIVDEGTFHQFHGGVSTSDALRAAEEMKRASRKYYRLRGRVLQPVRDPGHLFRSGQPETARSTEGKTDATC